MVEDLLGHLYPDDTGNYIPIPGIEYEVRKKLYKFRLLLIDNNKIRNHIEDITKLI